MSGAKVASKLELSTLVESLGSESGTEVESYKGMSDGNVESKFKVFSGLSDKVVSGEWVEMASVTLA